MHTATAKRRDVSHCTDTELVDLVRGGNGDAFRAIMQRYNQRLYRVARGIVRDEAEAEDVLQEAYVRGFAALREFRGDSGLATWLTRIVMNEAFGRMRRRRPTEELESLDRAIEQGDTRVIMFPETAAQLDIRPETVKTRLHRARKLLRQHLDEKLASVLKDTFPFEGARCARITDGVLARLGLADRSNRGALLEKVPRAPPIVVTRVWK